MAMPKATMHLHDRVMLGENDVGLAGERLVVESVSEPHPMQQAPHRHFGASVLVANQRHHLGPLACGDGVHHVTSSTNVASYRCQPATSRSLARRFLRDGERDLL
jgi:hypothetical protein